MSETSVPDQPAHRYDAARANEIETKWQKRWAELGVFEAPNPTGSLSDGFERFAGREKMFVLDMFPYPSGAGLHVGHPLGFIGTDVLARYYRMAGRNVLHTMGYDAFGLPAEQYAVQTGTHPRVTTANNIANMRRQLFRLGLGHDPRRSVSTTDVAYYKWTQWIFLQIFESWFDEDTQRARPITELVDELDNGTRALGDGRDWQALSEHDKRAALLEYRLAYVDDALVNWCPALGTVLSNEEVTNEGRSERGNYPVYRRPMRQWKMRITKYAERLLSDLDDVDWNESVKLMQRNWIGRSVGARVDFTIEGHDDKLTVFTTRPDTLFGATYMVVAPEHPVVTKITKKHWPDNTEAAWKGAFASESPVSAVTEYVAHSENESEIERTNDARTKTGVFTGAFAINPVNEDRIPIFVADYVLMGYGTGAIMAVPAHDQRDFDFARKFHLPITAVIKGGDDDSDAEAWSEAQVVDGTLVHSHNATLSLDGLRVPEAKAKICEWLEQQGVGAATVNYKLRDWLFSRQRYWGEPFPIVWDGDIPIAVPESQLPVELPELDDYAPNVVADDEETLPEPPLGRATSWRTATIDGHEYQRELNTMPQWAGSCWYYLRYMDPDNDSAMIDPINEQYWSLSADKKAGAVDLYVGGVEHAVLHLLYARFWHKILFDLGHVSTKEPFQKLFNQGMIQADVFEDSRGIRVEAKAVEEIDGKYFYEGKPVTKYLGKMGKSLKNSVNPDDIYRDFGADSLRIYEMAMGPLDQDRPWTDQGIVGPYRFLQRLWRNLVDEETGELSIGDSVDDQTRRLVHKTIAGVRDDLESMRFNTAVAKLIELNNHFTKHGSIDRETAEATVLMIAPIAPHIAEELWAKLGHQESLTWTPFPVADPKMLVEDTIQMPVQVQGKVRAKLVLPAETPVTEIEAAALADPNVVRHIGGKTVKKVVVVPGRMVNIVI